MLRKLAGREKRVSKVIQEFYTSIGLRTMFPFPTGATYKIWYAYVKEQRHFARLKFMVKI